ncbi:MAG: hypothetical protein IKH57_02975 [Clostridia bacterium]|nr:hypothetical protein [Clostridia bacterium]
MIQWIIFSEGRAAALDGGAKRRMRCISSNIYMKSCFRETKQEGAPHQSPSVPASPQGEAFFSPLMDSGLFTLWKLFSL